MKPTPLQWLAAYLCALVCFLLLDASWLTLMGSRLYQPALGSLMSVDVDWLAAALFYVIYLVGILVFAIAPALEAGRAGSALGRGALLGLVAYATYDLTNQSTLQGWPWTVTLADMAWGAVVSGSAAWLSARLTSRPTRRTAAR